MVAMTDHQGARMFDLMTKLGELVRDGKRNPGLVLDILQFIKDHENGPARLMGALYQADAGAKTTSPLLEFIRTVTIPARAERFIASERFVLNSGPKAKPGVKISYLGDNFKRQFLGKTEEPAKETTLRYSKLLKSSLDGSILAELGDKAKTTLAQIYALMQLQPNGEEGTLLNNGRANIFYVDDCAVYVRWGGGGWIVVTYPVTDPSGWDVEYRVFSRNS